jgi:hypothetical protein
MDIRGPDRPSNAPCCLDLLRRQLRLCLGLRIGLDSRPHPRIAGCRGDDLFMAVGSGSGSICDLPSFWHSSGVINLHHRIRWHHRNRNDLVVACSEEQVLKLDHRERVIPTGQLMRIRIDHSNLRASPRSLYRGRRWIDIIEIVDQSYGPVSLPKIRSVWIRSPTFGALTHYANDGTQSLFPNSRPQWSSNGT